MSKKGENTRRIYLKWEKNMKEKKEVSWNKNDKELEDVKRRQIL